MAEFTKQAKCQCCSMKLNLFRFLSDEELREVNKNRFEVHYKKGETIFKQGAALTHIACITNGLAKVYMEGFNDKNIVLKVLRQTELVGGPGFPTDYRHHFSVAALTNTSACLIDINDFEKVLRNNATFAIEFIKHLNKATIRLHDKIKCLTQKQMHGRMAETLLYLCEKVYLNNDFETTLSRQDLADMSAMTKESAIRVLKEFKDEKIIDFNHNDFHILDTRHLETISRTG